MKMTEDQEYSIKKINIICSKGSVEDVYAALILGNGAVMEGIAANLFFTFFGIDAVISRRMENLHTAAVGNPSLRMPGGSRLPSLLGIIPGLEAFISSMMMKEMERIDIPPVSELLEMITAGGGRIYACKLAMDMFRVQREDLSAQVSDVLTVGEFYSVAGGKGSHIIFI
jgi:peroxiredoxin family protein